ncbi:acyl-CoA synthetase [Mesorhizobium sp. Cs1299R1N3]|uniref:acyl-CoA synthetase n=1 Tax=Mesorhizobium sp. Cs1299R1N3 TaxID=3015173 RepID=UPI00301D7F75
MASPYEQDLDRNAANHQPLTPLTYLERAAKTYPDHIAIIHGGQRISYRDFWRRSLKLASALHQHRIGKGDTVTVMLSNTPPMLEAHFGVPMTKAVLHSLNTRLDAAVIAFQLDHAETKVLIVDREFSGVVREALDLAKVKPLVIDYDDPDYAADAPYPKGERVGTVDYEAFVANGDEEFAWSMPDDEWDAISLNYTSGTTGNPKGVVYHHRGAALMAYTNTIHAGMAKHAVYLWTLPMFHCNGWCFPWTLAVQAGTHVCLRWVRPKPIYDAIADHGVTHLCGAPVVMSVLINAREEDKRAFAQTVTFNTAAAPPPEAVLSGMSDAGFAVTHLYGLTETYGPAVVNEWHNGWDALDKGARAGKKARQGVRYAALEGLTVMDPETMAETPADGETIGEVMFRGNIVMKGYLKNRKATDEAFAGGWFHSGDLGVMHPDGYIQLKDRSKDIIISGGENISSIEVEDALYKHPAVASCGVVARHDDKWGEVPVAYIELKPGKVASEAEIIEHCRTLLARFKVPKAVIFAEIPKTSTGKIQKFRLREMAKVA